ncbi:glycoside hydrolase family 2 protein, partial [Silvibacterium sp.]|uniref:glycoside hydrolase family 2 protein n=1 Tax=Silvibacterium sp. TaxID=1964179 RepID=UPI0039E71145
MTSARSIALFTAALLSLPAFSVAQSSAFHDGWKLQSACKATENGVSVSKTGYDDTSWIATSVPSTVVAAQVKAKLFPDPYFGDNLRKLPGMNYPVGKNFANLPMTDDSPYRCGWWYRKTFAAPASNKNEHTWLHFGGINYRAELWVNGHRIADKNQIAGAYRTYDFDVTSALEAGHENVVAIEVFAPTEKDLGINWVDWNPAPPDKDMGLWGDVDLISTGAVTLRSPMAVTHFTDDTLSTAEVSVYAEVHNATDHAVNATVSGTIAGAAITQSVALQPNEDKTVIFMPDRYPALRITHPKPWWPAQMGEPHLESLKMQAAVSGVKTDEQTTEVGLREVSSELTANGSRLFRVNGKPILIRGAGWSQDMLLRSDPQRLRDQIRMVKDMHLNTIRLEGKLETDDFFRLTDQQGILVMLGWCCCDHWEKWETWTDEDRRIADASLHDQLLRLRQHPSLLVWLNGSDNAPPADVEKSYLDVEASVHWPTPIIASASATDTVNSGPSGVKMTGPYDYVEPSYWHVDTKFGGAYGFNTETSPGPAIPSLASRKLFLSDPEAWPATEDWSLHYGGGEFKNLNVFDEAMTAIYAKPANAADYERMAQTMTYDSERAMFESYSRNKYSATGVVQWMLNNAWPSMIWHLYDYNLDADAGYFAVKRACEPLHIQYSYDDRSIVAVNSTYQPASELHAAIRVHNLEWK